MAFDGLPLVVAWEMTLACNLRCRHCGSSAGRPRRQELNLDESLGICAQFPELLVQRVVFSGGEPLLNPNWVKIAERLGSLGIQTEMITNGINLNPTVVAQIRDTGIRSIGVSLDGMEGTHNDIRGRSDAFRLSLSGMKRAKSAGIALTALTTVNKANIKQLPEIFALLASLEVRAWQVQPFVPFGRGQSASDLNLTEQEYLQIGDFVQNCLPLAKLAGIQIATADSLGYYAEFETCPQPWRGCSAGLAGCAITSDGKVKGCLSMPDLYIEGDLREKDLWDIWFGPDAFSYNRHFSSEQLGSYCQNCDRAQDCQGGCSSKSYGLTGKFHNDPMCYYRLGQAVKVAS